MKNLIFIFLILSASTIYLGAQTCDDGIQNGAETGIDCGAPGCAPCIQLCEATIFNDDFETSLGNWSSSRGGFARLDDNPNTGNYSAVIYRGDNFYSDVFDASSISTLELKFSLFNHNLDAGEEVRVAISTDGGNTYTLVDTLIQEIDFSTDRSAQDITITGPFSNQTSLKLEVIANWSFERIYIDDVEINSCINVKAPTCFDGIQNGDETGIDCGGSCQPCVVLGQNCGVQIIQMDDFTDGFGNWSLSSGNASVEYGKLHFGEEFNASSGTINTTLDLSQLDSLKIRFNGTFMGDYAATTLVLRRNGSTIESWNYSDPGNLNQQFEIDIAGPFTSDETFSFFGSFSSSASISIDNIEFSGELCEDILGNPQWSGSSTNENTIYRNGAVAIGLSDPGEFMLAVNGDIKAQKIRVSPEDWPDYVFESGYQYPTLSEVELFIKQNGHLPKIPSAKEVFEGGIELSEINVKLLEKIEEMTLYIIELEKRLSKLEKVNDQ